MFWYQQHGLCVRQAKLHIFLLIRCLLYITQLRLHLCNIILSFPFCMKPTLQKGLHTNRIERHITAVMQMSLYFLFQSPLFISGTFKAWSIPALNATDKTLSCVQQTSQVFSIFLYQVTYNYKNILIISLDILNVLKSIARLTWTNLLLCCSGIHRLKQSMPKRKAGKMAKSYDPIAPVAEEISEEACLLCFDEFQVIIFWSFFFWWWRHVKESDSACIFLCWSFNLACVAVMRFSDVICVLHTLGHWYCRCHDSQAAFWESVPERRRRCGHFKSPSRGSVSSLVAFPTIKQI